MLKTTSLLIHKSFRRNMCQNLPSVSQILSWNKTGDSVKVKGWIKSLRDQKDHIFCDLSDGSSAEKLQICISKKIKPPGLSTGASVIASGCLTLSPKGQIELSTENVEVCGTCVVADGYPFAPRKQYAAEYIRQYLHLRPRTNKFGALLRIRNAATVAVHNYLNSEGFINVHTPILTSNDCEGAGEIFKVVPENNKLLKEEVHYFNKKAFLTVSGQLHLEACAHGLGKVYSLGPTFRAENSRSRLHLSEFYMLEAEIAFLNNLEQIIAVVEKLLKQVTEKILNTCNRDIGVSGDPNQIETWIKKQFPVLTYNEAVDILVEHKFNDFTNGLSKEHELFLVKHCGNIPIFIVNFPKELKPFYMKENSDGSTVAALDLLGPVVGEVVGGSLREDNYEKLKSVTNPNLDWYLELRKFGSVPTGGFGLGFERYLQMILGIPNIRDAIPFPRWPHNCQM